MSYQTEFRDSLIECLRRELVGPDVPPGQSDESLQESPRQRYSAGVLFPINQPFLEQDDARADEATPDDDDDANAPPETVEGQVPEPVKAGGGELRGDAEYDEMIRLANAFFPSAIGLTFIAEFPERGLRIDAHAAVYQSQKPADLTSKLRQWQRKQLDIKPVVIQVNQGTAGGSQQCKLAENLALYMQYRRREDGAILFTVSMLNTRTASGSEPPSGSDCFFQVGFSISDPDGRFIFREYKASIRPVDDPEEASLELLYRNRRAYAVGHGCAADWGREADEHTDLLETSSMPVFTVAPIVPRSEGGDELSMHYLSGAEGTVRSEQIPATLANLASDYERWIEQREDEATTLADRFRERANAHIAECRACLRRIRGGIELLRKDENARTAFMLANRAMLIQQNHSKRSRRGLEDPWVEFPESYAPGDSGRGRWRSFQLAFILMNLPSLTPSEHGAVHPDRDIVDLIWFPTGGGKTEAYLGLAAYTIFLRRLLNPKNAGCAVLMRYTLRLLTAQQFQRAAAMICACEVIRLANPQLSGESSDRITIGLWVGQSLSPNTREEAIRTANALARREPQAENPFQILTCPWCGTEMDNPRDPGYVPAGSPKSVYLICPDRRCAFSTKSNSLPVMVVDDDIYDSPPTLIIGTVDKFAMLAWRQRAGAIFGLGTAVAHDPPDLIIQDELHLIAGPLGSVVGLYEGVIDLLCSRNRRSPKIVASTATIRRAKQQCQALYDRNMFQFPPSGLDIADSFFARENAEAAGRTYLGVFAAAAPSFVTALIRTAGAVLQGCRSLPLPDGADESVRDAYWTMLQYFSSLRELGHAATLVVSDIPEYMWAIASRSHIPKELCRHLGAPVELTSRRNAQEIPEILERLKVTYPRASGADARPLDTLLATNMISVGVDIDRLGLMAIVGQPKTTSEYIQASSRVGRSEDALGLIITLFNPSKPRDRSHFEHFRAYHGAFYKHVEPTSVTPYSIPVLERALHGVLVIAARHLAGIDEPDQIDPDAVGIAELCRFLKERSGRIDADHAPLVMEKLEYLIRQWATIRPGEWGRFGTAPESRPLMYPAGSEPRAEWDDLSWATPSSMRSVDVECEARVLGIYGEA